MLQICFGRPMTTMRDLSADTGATDRLPCRRVTEPDRLVHCRGPGRALLGGGAQSPSLVPLWLVTHVLLVDALVATASSASPWFALADPA